MSQAGKGTHDTDGVPVDDWDRSQACQSHDGARGIGERGFHADINALNAIELHCMPEGNRTQLSCV